MMLGRYLARGLAGDRDADQARTWLERAVAQGLQEARSDLAALPPPPHAEPPHAASQAVGR
jgi:TPR repeat protein